VVVVGRTAHGLDDGAEQDEAVVGILETRARLEGWAERPIQPHVVAVLPQIKVVLFERRTEDVAGASGVGEQMPHCHLGSAEAGLCGVVAGNQELFGISELANPSSMNTDGFSSYWFVSPDFPDQTCKTLTPIYQPPVSQGNITIKLP
jgi:hypothetical protein